jgi:biotin-(acetyl-CoA carboxylase) ligase
VNINHECKDFPVELRKRATSLKLVTGTDWPLLDGQRRLAASMTSWLKKLLKDRRSSIVLRARSLSRSFLGQEISFCHQGRILRGIYAGIAADGGLLLKLAGEKEKIFYDGEIGCLTIKK